MTLETSAKDISIPPDSPWKKSSIRGGRPRFQTGRIRFTGIDRAVGFPSKMKTRGVSSNPFHYLPLYARYSSSSSWEQTLRGYSRNLEKSPIWIIDLPLCRSPSPFAEYTHYQFSRAEFGRSANKKYTWSSERSVIVETRVIKQTLTIRITSERKYVVA